MCNKEGCLITYDLVYNVIIITVIYDALKCSWNSFSCVFVQ